MTAERPLRPARPLAAATVTALLLGLLTLLTAAPAQAFFGDDEARKAIIDLRGRVADNDKRAQEAVDALARKLETAQRSQLELVNQNDLLRQEIARRSAAAWPGWQVSDAAVAVGRGRVVCEQ